MAETYPIIRFVLDGTPVEFAGSDILECNVLLETHPISATLPVSTASASIFTTDPRFSIFSDGTFYNALSKNLPMTLYVYVDGITQLIGQFYLDTWEMETENTLRFQLVDILGVCANTEYPGSFWETDTHIFFIIDDILKYVGNSLHYFDPSLLMRKIRGWIPPSSVRDALQQVCFAARAIAKTDMLNKIIFFDATLPEQSQAGSYATVTNAEKAGEQVVTHLPQITDIELISHDYYNLGAEAQTVEEIYSAWLEPGNYIISYPKPYWKVWGEGAGAFPIYVATEDGRVIVTEDSVGVWGDATVRVATESESFMFGSNFVSVNVVTAGQITLWGYPWLSADRPHRHHEIEDTGNAIVVENAMLVNSDIAADVLAKIVQYYNLRHQTQCKIFPKLMALGSSYKIDSFREKQLLGVAERFEIDLTGGYINNATFRGMEYIPE